jgi:DNA-binding beta-propeller fold protein YncE
MSLLAVIAGRLLSACVTDPGVVSLPMNAGIDVTLIPLSSFGTAGSPNMIAGENPLQLGYAAAVAATGNVIYVIDAAASGLVRLDEASGEVRLLYELRDTNTTGLHVSQDMIIQVVDRYNRAVIEIDQSGWERRRFSDSRLIPAPVDVTQTNWGSTILIADELSQRLAMFDSMSNPTGLFTTTLSPVAVAASIRAIAATANYVFVLDGASREVTQLDLSGRPFGTHGEDALLAPMALAVDECQRIFVADGHSDGLFVTSPEFYGSNTRASLPPEVTPAVTDLWVDNNSLYVAAGNLGVYVMAIDPPCMGP